MYIVNVQLTWDTSDLLKNAHYKYSYIYNNNNYNNNNCLYAHSSIEWILENFTL